MKYTKTAAALGLFMSIGSVQAVTVSVSGAANSTAQGSSDFGTFSTALAGLVGDNTSPPQTLTHTVSGLTIDGHGLANDSVVLNFTITTDGQNIQTSGTSAAGWFSSGATTLNGNGEFVQIDYASMTVTLSGGGATATESFIGFTGVSFGSWAAGHTATANGLSITFDDQIVDDNRFLDLSGGGADPSLKTLFDTAANNGSGTDAAGSWRPEGWDFQFEVTAVPEPSSTALIGLGGLALILRRRK